MTNIVLYVLENLLIPFITIKSMTQSISEIDQNLKSTANERPS